MVALDKVLMADSAMTAGYGSFAMVAPKKMNKVFFNNENISKEHAAMYRWAAWGCLTQAVTLMAVNKYGDDKTKRTCKGIMVGALGASIVQTWVQKEKSGYDKTQAVVNTALQGGMIAANVADLVKEK
mmetsp:Transcript_13508/g.49141  ORF Transcript_13508/g.49141 Transcript_13508/m.49141 type:complete len:128 (-) Transcript_13508:211-594(-)